MKKKIVLSICLFAICANGIWAEDHVMAATKKAETREVPATLNLSLTEAQDYAVETNRSLKNASLAVVGNAEHLSALDGQISKVIKI